MTMQNPLNLSDGRAEAYRDAIAAEDRGPLAFVAVLPPDDDRLPDQQGALGIAIANEWGYQPVPCGWARYATLDAAQDHADHLNRSILSLSVDEAFSIVASTMGGRRYPKPAA